MLVLMVKPKARKNEVVAWEGATITLRVKAPPVEGKANEECRRFLATVFGVASSRVVITRGEGSRTKRVEIRGIAGDEVDRARRRWAANRFATAPAVARLA